VCFDAVTLAISVGFGLDDPCCRRWKASEWGSGTSQAREPFAQGECWCSCTLSLIFDSSYSLQCWRFGAEAGVVIAADRWEPGPSSLRDPPARDRWRTEDKADKWGGPSEFDCSRAWHHSAWQLQERVLLHSAAAAAEPAVLVFLHFPAIATMISSAYD
jgi:hypothetical protein